MEGVSHQPHGEEGGRTLNHSALMIHTERPPYSVGCHREQSEAISRDCGACSERNEESPSLLRLRFATAIAPRNDDFLIPFKE
jgi:hypothetical protein